MEKRSVEAIVHALNQAGVRYLIAGGLAVVAHGYVRYTRDVDLVIDLNEDNLRKAVPALKAIGYRPMVPVAFEDFIDSRIRAQWINDKHLLVFSLTSTQHDRTPIDIFVEHPFDFERAYRVAHRLRSSADLETPFVSYDDLVTLKKKAGRTKDLEDLTKLKQARGE